MIIDMELSFIRQNCFNSNSFSKMKRSDSIIIIIIDYNYNIIDQQLNIKRRTNNNNFIIF